MKFTNQSRGSNNSPQKSWNSHSPQRGGGRGRGGFRGGHSSRGGASGGFNRGRGGPFRGGRGTPRHSFDNNFRGGRGNPRHSFDNSRGQRKDSGERDSKSAPNTPGQKKFDAFTPKNKKFQEEEFEDMDSGLNSENESEMSDEEIAQKTPAKGILKTPSNASTTKKAVNISSAKSPTATSKTPSTPHPASKKATAVVEPQPKNKLNFDDEESDEEDEDDEEDEESDEDNDESDDEQLNMAKSKVLPPSKKQNVAVAGKTGKITAKTENVGKGVVQEKGKVVKPKLAFPADSDEDEMESDEDLDEDELENEDEEMSEFEDEEGSDEEESEDEEQQLKSVKSAAAKSQNVAASGKAGKITAKAESVNKNTTKAKETGAKPKLAFPSDSEEDEDEMESDEDLDEDEQEDEEEESEDEKPKAKQASKVVPESDSEDDEDEEEASDEEEEASDEEEEDEGPIAKKQKIAQAPKKPVAVVSPLEQSNIVKEEERRRSEKNSRSLFIKGIPPKMKDSELKALHSDIIQARRRKTVGWLLFPSKESADKAHKKLSTMKLPGESKTLFVDYCDERSSHKSDKASKAQFPINPLEIAVLGLPHNVTKEQIQVVFKKAVYVMVHKSHGTSNPKAFVRFDNENDARDAFEKSKSLKIGGEPVDVVYARINVKSGANQNLPAQKPKQSAEKPKENAPLKGEAKVGKSEAAPKVQQSKIQVDKPVFKKAPNKSFPGKGQKRPMKDHGSKQGNKKPRA